MEAILFYFLKFSIGISLVFIFYRFVLSALTFYQWNRVYLFAYSLLSFLLPLIDIGPWMHRQEIADGTLIDRIPYVGPLDSASPFLLMGLSLPALVGIAVAAGILVMTFRALVQFYSLRKISAQSTLLHAGPLFSVYETSAEVNPFSFGNTIYINRKLHREEELARIIQHEIVHVKQHHTADLLLAELLCILNWYNPFAWYMRNAIRQNLEFIADDQVLSSGHDRKAYQYLLLKVLGAPGFSMGSHFSLPDLKKRIAMMNKIKTARLHLARFLFALPLIACVLLAFRSNQWQQPANASSASPKALPAPDAIAYETLPMIAPDTTVPGVALNNKGYIVTIADNQGECIVLVRDKDRKILKAMPLVEWNADRSANEAKYGEIPPPPPPAAPPVPPAPPVIAPKPPAPPAIKGEPPVPPKPAAAPVKPVPEVDAKPVVAPVSKVESGPTNMTAESITINTTGKGPAPLYIIDGEEQDASFDVNSIKPNTIKSISVWKGESAVEKFGGKGKNGVLVITLRK